MKAFIVIGLVVTLLSGCAASGQRAYSVWVRPGATQADFNRTNARCRMAAIGVGRSDRSDLNMNTAAGNIQAAGRNLQDAADIMMFMNDCFIADGWTSETRYQ